MKTKKILYVRNGPYEVNPSMYNLQEIGFCRALCERGYDCDIIYYSKVNKDEVIFNHNKNRVKLLWRKGYKILRTGFYPSLLKKEFVNKYDLIITTEYSQIMSLFWSFFDPKVVLYNGPYYNLFKIPIIEKIYDKLFVSKLNNRMYKTFTKSNLASNYLMEKGFTKVITLGVGLNNSVFKEENNIPNHMKNLIKFLNENPNLLYVGSLDDRKNFPFLLKLFEKVNNERPDIKLVIVGNGKKNYIEKNFNIINEETRNNIIHISKMENKYLKEIYSRSEIFLLPSKKEIFGMVLLEAMSFGAVPISSLNGGSSTLIDNKKNGFIINDFQEENWKRCILELINNKKMRLDLSDHSKRKVDELHSWSYIADKFLKEINEIL